MSKSLDDLENDPNLSLPERIYQLCLNGKLIADLQVLESRKGELDIELVRELAATAAKRGAVVAEDGETKGPPRRQGQRTGESPKSKKIRKEIDDLDNQLADKWDSIAEYTGNLRLRAFPPSAWIQWVDDHPAREKNARDAEIAAGKCNADDLLAALPEFAATYNDEPIRTGRFDSLIRANAQWADLKGIAQTIVAMHEYEVDLPKWREDSLSRRGSAIG